MSRKVRSGEKKPDKSQSMQVGWKFFFATSLKANLECKHTKKVVKFDVAMHCAAMTHRNTPTWLGRRAEPKPAFTTKQQDRIVKPPGTILKTISIASLGANTQCKKNHDILLPLHNG